MTKREAEKALAGAERSLVFAKAVAAAAKVLANGAFEHCPVSFSQQEESEFDEADVEARRLLQLAEDARDVAYYATHLFCDDCDAPTTKEQENRCDACALKAGEVCTRGACGRSDCECFYCGQAPACCKKCVAASERGEVSL